LTACLRLRHTALMDNNYPIIVVGAGAAGMMAAGRAAELGADVLLLEKMERPGQKILLTGNGHCNLTNCLDIDNFIAQFGPNGPMTYSGGSSATNCWLSS
jgi:predicted flavoprotein YhiN